jgi:hypothetical protein
VLSSTAIDSKRPAGFRAIPPASTDVGGGGALFGACFGGRPVHRPPFKGVGLPHPIFSNFLTEQYKIST